ncbi:MAG: septum site-determining protein MinC [Clostridia bacterium]|nr:septum site-determining protein MinC [Clostridia bacterium]
MQLTPPSEILRHDKPPEIYPHLYNKGSQSKDFGKKDPQKADKASHINDDIGEVEIPSDMTILIQRTLRSGQSIRYPGHVVILGDVNPGAEVVAGGNILVFGTLRGIAHAGAHGNTKAIVAAFKLNPTQVRIAGYITRAPDNAEDDCVFQHPEVARVYDGKVVIEKLSMGGNKVSTQ